jgi:glycosyltransferase involved in cell wall biosynthesis
VIPTRNRHEALDETLKGFRSQSLGASEYEIIVVDDGSVPAVHLPSWGDGPSCRLIRLEGDERSAARNAGARSAQGDVVIFVDDDISVDSNFLEAHLAAHLEWPGALVVGSVRLPDDVCARPFGRFRQALEKTATPESRGVVSAKNLCTAQNMSMARRRLAELGGFDEGMVTAEDQDLALRHSQRDGTIVFAPEAAGIHRDVFSDLRSYCRHMEWGYERIIPFCLRHPAWPDNVERDRVNGRVRWRFEPLGRTIRKLVKGIVASRVAIEILFTLSTVLERRGGSGRILYTAYRLLLGAHIFRGYRRGLAQNEMVLTDSRR